MKILLPEGHDQLLLHSCCATCSGVVMNRLYENKIKFTVIFYNPNIFPQDEYIKRKDDNKKFADKLGVPFIDLDYDSDLWLQLTKGLEDSPERGERCGICFHMRMLEVARYAKKTGFNLIATTMGISRFKDLEQVDFQSREAALQIGVEYFDFNWRKDDGGRQMYEVAKREEFYRQEYCGCPSSFNHRR